MNAVETKTGAPKQRSPLSALSRLVLTVNLLPIPYWTWFRSGTRALLSAELDFELVGEATDGDDTVAMAASLQPDLVLMDVRMPGIGGIEATRRIVNANPNVRVLVVTMFEDDHTVFMAMRAALADTF